MFKKLLSRLFNRTPPQEPFANPLLANSMPRAEQKEVQKGATDSGSPTTGPAERPVPTSPAGEPQKGAGDALKDPTPKETPEPKTMVDSDKAGKAEPKAKKPKSESVEKIARKIIVDEGKYSELLERLNGRGKDAGSLVLGEFVALREGGNSVRYRFCEYHGGKNNQTAHDFDVVVPVALTRADKGTFHFTKDESLDAPKFEEGKLVLAEIRGGRRDPTRIGFVPLKGSGEIEAILREIVGQPAVKTVDDKKAVPSGAATQADAGAPSNAAAALKEGAVESPEQEKKPSADPANSAPVKDEEKEKAVAPLVSEPVKPALPQVSAPSDEELWSALLGSTESPANASSSPTPSAREKVDAPVLDVMVKTGEGAATTSDGTPSMQPQPQQTQQPTEPDNKAAVDTTAEKQTAQQKKEELLAEYAKKIRANPQAMKDFLIALNVDDDKGSFGQITLGQFAVAASKDGGSTPVITMNTYGWGREKKGAPEGWLPISVEAPTVFAGTVSLVEGRLRAGYRMVLDSTDEKPVSQSENGLVVLVSSIRHPRAGSVIGVAPLSSVPEKLFKHYAERAEKKK